MPKIRLRDPNSDAAVATRRWRERKAQKLCVVPVQVFQHEIRVLIRLGYLESADAHDRAQIGTAVAQILEEFCR